MRKSIFFALAAIWLMTADIAQSCPAFVTADKFPDWTRQSAPKNLRLFAINKKTEWEQRPLQVDPMNDQGLFDATRLKSDDYTTISARDRFVFYTDDFGLPINEKVSFPCNASQVVELISPQQSFAYLANCDQSSSPSIASSSPPVSLESPERKIASKNFEYIYNPRNELLYESLRAKSTNGLFVRSAYDSDIGLRLDLKNFFTLHFDNGDIESYVNSSKTGELGVVEGVAFFLRLFALKIDLKMNTVASFFESSANIPMIVDVPRDAFNHLNPGSGSMYSLKLDQAEFDIDHPMSTMPSFEGKLVKSGSPDFKTAGLRRCKGDRCDYKMMGHVGKDPFALAMSVPRQVVEMGFFPTFVYDVKGFKSDLGWKGADKSPNNERAIYFETSGLAKGQYKVESWILLGDASQKNSTCPGQATVSKSWVKSESRPVVGH